VSHMDACSGISCIEGYGDRKVVRNGETTDGIT
jgi:hypothetical protein